MRIEIHNTTSASVAQDVAKRALLSEFVFAPRAPRVG
jgi:hypothetical protein